MDLIQEEILIARAKVDPSAFGELYDAYYSQILGYAIKRTANIEVAQDVTSETFFKALKSIGRFRWKGVPFSSWLYRIASHEIANYYQKDKRSQTVRKEVEYLSNTSDPSLLSEIKEAEFELEKYKEFLALHKSIARLPLKYQEVITLRFFEKKHIKEIGEILHKKDGTIKSLLHRGLERLRKLMEEMQLSGEDAVLPNRG